MLDYNHMIGVKMVGEMLPNEANRVTLADDLDQYGLRVARITYAWGDNDKALVKHALEQMSASIAGDRREGHVPPGRRHLPSGRHGAHGERSHARASSMPIAGAGTSRIFGCAMDRCFQPSAASIRR